MIKEALEYIAKLAAANRTDLPDVLGESTVFDKPVFRAPLPTAPPTAKALPLLTLRSLVQFVARGLESLDPAAAHFLHVEPWKVSYLSTLSDFHRQREEIVSAIFTPSCGPYIDKWLPLEDAIIGLMAEFSDTGTRAAVIELLRNVKHENTEIREDSGAAQNVKIQAGIHLVELAKVPNPVTLAPFRTFAEVEQPESLFALRLRQTGSGPEVLLKQADGSGWEVVAAERIGSFLVNALKSSGAAEAGLPLVIY